MASSGRMARTEILIDRFMVLSLFAGSYISDRQYRIQGAGDAGIRLSLPGVVMAL
jgi:hypothetical protein